MGAGDYGGEHFRRIVGDEQEDGSFRGFLHHFQKLIGSLHLHSFREPYNEYLIFRRIRRERLAADDSIGILHIYARLGIAGVYDIEPFLSRHCRISLEHLFPLGDEIIGDNDFPGLAFYKRKNKMKVRMVEVAMLEACLAMAARFAIPGLLTM